LLLEVEVAQARNQVDRAVELIQTSAARPGLAPLALKPLAELAERLGRVDIAEQLYRRYEALPNVRDGKIVRAKFLGRQGQIKEALDLCEPLWADPRDVEVAAAACISVVTSAKALSDPEQLERVTSRLKQAIKQRTDSTFLLVGLGNCLEQQKRYDEAKTIYQSVINRGNRDAGASPNTTRWLASSYNNLAWLLAFKDDQGKNALADVDNAIKLVGALPSYLDTRGVIYLSLKQTQDAITDLQSAAEAEPSPSKSFHLAQAYLQANDREKAKHYLKDARAKKLDQLGASSGGLHPLEQPVYQKVLSELGTP
jgi:cellulose synthase operon protein C